MPVGLHPFQLFFSVSSDVNISVSSVERFWSLDHLKWKSGYCSVIHMSHLTSWSQRNMILTLCMLSVRKRPFMCFLWSHSDLTDMTSRNPSNRWMYWSKFTSMSHKNQWKYSCPELPADFMLCLGNIWMGWHHAWKITTVNFFWDGCPPFPSETEATQRRIQIYALKLQPGMRNRFIHLYGGTVRDEEAQIKI